MKLFAVLPFVLTAGTFTAHPDEIAQTDPAGVTDAATDPALALADASEPSRALLDPGRCLGAAYSGDDEPEFRAHCLAICEGDEVYTVISRKRKIKDKAHWCEYIAKEFCIQRGEDYEDWCWGVPREYDSDD